MSGWLTVIGALASIAVAAAAIRPSAFVMVWAVARQTFLQCLRTKVAAVFFVLLAVSLGALPSVMEGDGTLAGRIRTFLDYSTTITAVLLSLVVVFLSVGAISNDVRDKHVFMVCIKPLGRWQYVTGRWLGVVLLAMVLLGVSAGMIYGMAQYLRGRDELVSRPEDRRAVETEIFAARTEVSPQPPDVLAELKRRVQDKQASGAWQASVEQYKLNYKLTELQAQERLLADLKRELTVEQQSVAPGKSLAMRFGGVRVAESGLQGAGTVTGFSAKAAAVQIECPREVAERLLVRGPVVVNDRVGLVQRRWSTGFVASFGLEDLRTASLIDLKAGSQVRVLAQPTVQVSYKLSPVGGAEGERNLATWWEIENPTTREMYFYEEPRPGAPVDMRGTLVAPARLADANGDMVVRYINRSRASVMMNTSDISVLYTVGSFEPNFVKAFVLMAMGLAFLAALGTLAGSFVSFPVGCLLSLVLLCVAAAIRFLTEAVTAGLEGPDAGVLLQVARAIVYVMNVVLPDVGSTLGTRFVVDGLVVPWATLAEAGALTLAIRGSLLLLVACWVFSRRELARVQV